LWRNGENLIERGKHAKKLDRAAQMALSKQRNWFGQFWRAILDVIANVEIA
jgi:hypothetical protein